MITKLLENKLLNYLKSNAHFQGLSAENIVAGVSQEKRELPCIVVICDTSSDYPNTPLSAGILAMSAKILIMQSNTESIAIFRDRSERVYNAVAQVETMRTAMNNDSDSELFVYGFRNLKNETAVEEQHFMVTISVEVIAS